LTKTTVGLIWKLLLASLIMGLVLSYFDITPAELIREVPETIGHIFELLWNGLRWAIDYILLGAVIVVPVWLLLNLPGVLEKFRRRK